MAKTPFIRKGALFVGSAVAPGIAFAMGDPGVIWWTGAIVLVQLVAAAILFWLPLFRPVRKPALIAYSVLLVIAWVWGANVPGPDFGAVYAVLLGGPLFLLVCVAAMALYRTGRGRP